MPCDCRSVEPMLAPYVDGEAEPRIRAEVEEHIGACPPCRDRVVVERAARDMLQSRRDGLRVCATEHLRHRCAAHRTQIPVAQQPTARRGLLRQTVMPLAMAASLILVVGLIFFLGLNRGVELLAAQLAVDHIKCHNFVTKESDPDPVLLSRQWEQDRGWALNIPASASQYQLELLGVRRCGSTEGPNAHIMYKWRGEPLSVYVMNHESERARAEEQFVHKAGQDAVVWNQQGRTYVVVAKASPDDLHKIATYVKLNSR
jgi:anti-sigma factor RsiW